jgi:hypothetical protein
LCHCCILDLWNVNANLYSGRYLCDPRGMPFSNIWTFFLFFWHHMTEGGTMSHMYVTSHMSVHYYGSYIYIYIYIYIWYRINYMSYWLDGCKYRANNQGSNTHLYIISAYFLHKLSYYSSREKIIWVRVDSKEMLMQDDRWNWYFNSRDLSCWWCSH